MSEKLSKLIGKYSIDNKIKYDRIQEYKKSHKHQIAHMYLGSFAAVDIINGYNTLITLQQSGVESEGNFLINLIKSVGYGLGFGEGTIGPTVMGTLFLGTAVYGFRLYLVTRELKIEEDQNVVNTEKGDQGTAHEMNYEEQKKYLYKVVPKKSKGYLLGMDTEKDLIVEKNEHMPLGEEIGPHTYIAGPSGSRKSRSIIVPNMLNAINSGKSVIVTDPKGELYEKTAVYAEEQGAIVRQFNLVDTICSDSCAFLKTIGKDERMAQTVASILILNSSGDAQQKKDFWTNGGLALTAFGLLFVALSEGVPEEKKTLGAVYDLLTDPGDNACDDASKGTMVFQKLSMLVEGLAKDHPARKQWNIFMTAPGTARDSVFMDVSTRLQILAEGSLKRITSYDEIDLELPMKQQCVYYVITSTEDDSYDSIAAMFFSLALYKQCRYAKLHLKRKRVEYFFDEFPSIGTIPYFIKMISLVRSNNMAFTIVSQDLGQLIDKYPGHAWETIISNCDTQIVLGVNEHNTNGKYWSEKTGEKTAIAGRQTEDFDVTAFMTTRRFALTADEVMRMNGHGKNWELIFIANAPYKLLRKVDYTMLPAGKRIDEEADKYQRKYFFHEPKWWEYVDRKEEVWFDNMRKDIEELQATYLFEMEEIKAEKEKKRIFEAKKAKEAEEKALSEMGLKARLSKRLQDWANDVPEEIKENEPDEEELLVAEVNQTEDTLEAHSNEQERVDDDGFTVDELDYTESELNSVFDVDLNNPPDMELDEEEQEMSDACSEMRQTISDDDFDDADMPFGFDSFGMIKGGDEIKM